MRKIIDEIPLGFSIMSPAGEVLEINAATNAIWAGDLPKAGSIDEFAMYRGFHRDTGRALEPDEWPAPQAIRTGQVVETVVDIERLDGRRRAARIKAVPMKDESGQLAMIVVMTEDVQDAVEREELVAALGEMATVAGALRDVDEILRAILQVAALKLGADRAIVSVRSGDAWSVEFEYCSADAGDCGDRGCGQPLSMNALADSRRPVLIEDAQNDPRCDNEVARRLGIGSLLHVPIYGEGRFFGSLLFCFDSERTPGAVQMDFASRLMDVTNIALDNVYSYQRERTIARTLQEAILSPPETVDGVETAWLYQPAAGIADVGGDFFDLFAVDEDTVAIVVGDVSGKGIGAARMTSLIRDGIRAYCYEDPRPDLVFDRLNSLVYRMSPPTVFATVFLGILDVPTGRLTYCSAGHPPAMLAHAGAAEQLTTCGGSIMGAFDTAEFEACHAALDEDATLILYTDGLSEARDGSVFFGEHGVLEAAAHAGEAPLAELPRRLYRAALEFGQGTLRDDTVVLCVRRRPVDGSGPRGD